MAPLIRRDYQDCGVLRLLRTFGHALRYPIEKTLPRMRQPTLVVRGALDPLCSQSWAETVASLLPDGRLRVIPGVSHTLVFAAPLELTRVARPFLNQAREPASRTPEPARG